MVNLRMSRLVSDVVAVVFGVAAVILLVVGLLALLHAL